MLGLWVGHALAQLAVRYQSHLLLIFARAEIAPAERMRAATGHQVSLISVMRQRRSDKCRAHLHNLGGGEEARLFRRDLLTRV